MDSDLRSSARAICDQIILWQAPSGGVSTEIRRYHRPPYLRKAISSGQDIPWLVRALYAFYDLTCEPRYKEAADRYAIFFMSCTLDRSHAWQIGGALEPCFTLYREHNPGDESLDPSAHALYRWLVGYRTDDGNYFNAGYGWRDAENVRHDEEDVGYSDDLSDVGRGLVAYYRLFKDAEALKHAIGLAKYFVREHRPGTMEGVWSGKAGTWLIGPRHNGGFENLFVSADEAGWGWSSYYCSLYLARLYDCLSDDEQKGIIRDRCVTSLKWMFDACQFDDGAVGMHQRDDKWLGMTACAILQYVELHRRVMVDPDTHHHYYPKALKALHWLRELSAPTRFPPDGYVPVTGTSVPDPGYNVVWAIALTAEGLLAGPALEAIGPT